MHILYIHQYFATPLGKTGTRSYEFARRWVSAGHKVTMLTSIAQLTPDDLKNASGRFIKRFTIEGIDVRAIAIGYAQKMGFIKRVLAFLGFMMVAVFYVLCKQGYDIIYATSTPLTIGIPALCAKWLRRKKFIFEVRDQWPEIPIEMGIIRNRILIKILLRLEKTIYKNTATIVALSPGMAEGIKTVLGIIPKPVTVIPNCCDTNLFNSNVDGSSIRKEKDWDDKFVLLHTGAMGKANGLGFVVSVAEKLRSYDDLLFVLVGQGGEKKELVERIKQLGLKNVEMSESVSKKDLPVLMAACDAAMIIFANYPILEHNSANKFFDSLSACKPVLLNYSGWQRELLEKNNAGYGTRLCDVNEFAQKVLLLYKDRQLLTSMGKNARRLAMEMFDRDILASQALSLLASESHSDG